jgi:hypothetical protein
MRSLVAVLLLLILPSAAVSGAAGAPPSIDEQGARHGQALAAARICPGARTTAKIDELAASIPSDRRSEFNAASDRILAAWNEAFACQDVDPAQYPREINSCRKSKILSCSTTWSEIGPEGSALPGLLEFAPED